MSPTSYQTAPPRSSIINKGSDIVKLLRARFCLATFAAASAIVSWRSRSMPLRSPPSRFEPFSDTTYRIQQQVPGIEQGTRFRKQELSISKQRGEHYL